MHNRGNGKGGGVAAAGLVAEQMGVSEKVLARAYLLQIAYLDPTAREEVEARYVDEPFDVHAAYEVPSLGDDWASCGLESRPPVVWRYFVRVKADVLDAFREARGLGNVDRHRAEDEFVYQNSYGLNLDYYSSLGEKRAFVLCHGRNLLVFKVVGYAEQLIRYYRLEDLKAHVWIGHQRYPTKGRVWHPGGAHPFIGLDEALVHNGDFANYASVVEYLKQRNIHPLFLTDTEVGVLLFDLLHRVYGYPLEYVIEAMAPTTERDFALLSEEKRRVYGAIQASHIHGSPDGPWFFILARTDPYREAVQLLGITDTSMLRPQVFALQKGEAAVGLIASEKQAIDATLRSLAAEDPRFLPVADVYWNARGGSHTDGGAFAFTLGPAGEDGQRPLTCTDKFDRPVDVPPYGAAPTLPNGGGRRLQARFEGREPLGGEPTPERAFSALVRRLPAMTFAEVDALLSDLLRTGTTGGDDAFAHALEVLTLLHDRVVDLGNKRPAAVMTKVKATLDDLLRAVPDLPLAAYGYVDADDRKALAAPPAGAHTLVVDAADFPPEGEDGLSHLLVAARRLGWRRVVAFDLVGQRFVACGLGPASKGFRVDAYGTPGDYLASGLDGGDVVLHGSGQDQVAQIMKGGTLVVHGDVGQTFMYGAKGGDVYVRGNAAGRPLINAVGRPRVVINGTCLDYLAESFMAGDPLKGGGFVVLNGVRLDERGRLAPLPEPYPGGNLFSLASGGAIYLRDPRRVVGEDQLNGGQFDTLTDADWALILPHLERNEGLFGIRVRDLLTVDGVRHPPHVVYRKIKAVELRVLAHTGL
jgi:glutamate synthase domain-containing protein 1